MKNKIRERKKERKVHQRCTGIRTSFIKLNYKVLKYMETGRHYLKGYIKSDKFINLPSLYRHS